MLSHRISLLLLPVLSSLPRAHAQDPEDLTGLTLTGTITDGGDGDVIPTGTTVSYADLESTIVLSTATDGTLLGTTGALETSLADANGTDSDSTRTSSSSQELTFLVGGQNTATSISGNATASANATMTSSSTSTSPVPTNVRPCNNYPEFCFRKYSNITEVCAHNSPFVRQNNAASNQYYPVTDQLNDGIRMLQGQIHYVNETLLYCHTSCDLLNAGPMEDYLTTVADWVKTHPYDVITILLGNHDQVDVSLFTGPIQNAGLSRYLYTPPQIPMGLDDWPTLSDMILTQKRVVFFMDYKANQTKVPYILDEFSQLWETPFSPTDPDFPCTVQRPPDLSDEKARDRLYMANHNLNVEVSFSGETLLIPDTANIVDTNAVNGSSSLGAMTDECTANWGRPPNFLLVDYYSAGNGSVFEVAAQANNVSYDRECCGTSSGGVRAAVMPPLTGSHPKLAVVFVAAVVSMIACIF
ncbi:PLC-like phosphodiesterase [Lineolata rhizophorae]|uniref:PLC-like phosphodiesterase n=1 Tax=Lineolata rhizophorae TaxID=578093 RepID=A0A6A6PBM5_9PEZI|nr:PLC-like phosphodiesterase [Lineolata rhizophorae]